MTTSAASSAARSVALARRPVRSLPRPRGAGIAPSINGMKPTCFSLCSSQAGYTHLWAML
jgi:hypothetical protein